MTFIRSSTAVIHGFMSSRRTMTEVGRGAPAAADVGSSRQLIVLRGRIELRNQMIQGQSPSSLR